MNLRKRRGHVFVKIGIKIINGKKGVKTVTPTPTDLLLPGLNPGSFEKDAPYRGTSFTFKKNCRK